MVAVTARKALRADERGANLVEMALILPLLLLLTMGVIDIGRAFYDYISLTNAAREGARYASRRPLTSSEEHIEAVVQRIQAEPVAPGAPWSTITAEVEGLGRPSGESVVVTATLSYPTFLGQLAGLEPLTLRARAEMRIFGVDGMTPTATP